jgi:transcriptional regulator with XRE-family HTH domain
MPRVPHPCKALIVARGERFRDVAEKVGVNPQSFSRIISGTQPSWPKLRRKVAEHLGVDEDVAWFPEDTDALLAQRGEQGFADVDEAVLDQVATVLGRSGGTNAAA